MLSEWNLKALMNLRNSCPKVRPATPDSKWEPGVCTRVHAHRYAFCIPSRSSMEVFKVRVGSMGRNTLGEKEESPRQRQRKGKESDVTQSCPTLQPHGLKSTRILCPWDFPGKSTGADCHFLPQDKGKIFSNSTRLEHFQTSFSLQPFYISQHLTINICLYIFVP